MAGLLEQRFQEWTQGKGALEARVSIYQKIKDIPYAVIPELVDAERYVDILRVWKGSCTPKHFLLGNMYQRLGMLVLYAVYPFRWDEVEFDYPPEVRKLAEELPTSYHLACRVDIDGELVLVDATLDSGMAAMGGPVSVAWDGVSNTSLPMNPCGEEELYHPSEARLIQPPNDERRLAFYREFNAWLEGVRSSLTAA